MCASNQIGHCAERLGQLRQPAAQLLIDTARFGIRRFDVLRRPVAVQQRLQRLRLIGIFRAQRCERLVREHGVRNGRDRGVHRVARLCVTPGKLPEAGDGAGQRVAQPCQRLKRFLQHRTVDLLQVRERQQAVDHLHRAQNLAGRFGERGGIAAERLQSGMEFA